MKRCVTAFATADRTVAAGTLVDDGDDVVDGHGEFFVDVSAEPQATVIPGTDKVEAKPRTDGGTVPDQNNTDNPQPEDEGGLPVSTQSGPGAAEAARRQAEEADDDEDRDTVEGDEAGQAQPAPVEQATNEPGQRRNTGRRG